jgi:hypothetical protein
MATMQIPSEGCVSFKTGTNLSACQYHAVRLGTTNKTVVVADGNGHRLIGILMNKPTSGMAAVVATQPGMIVPVYAGAAIALGDPLVDDASGHLIDTTTDTDCIIGYAMESAGAAGDIIEMLMVSPHCVGDATRWPDGA